jgi:hypothetical protein
VLTNRVVSIGTDIRLRIDVSRWIQANIQRMTADARECRVREAVQNVVFEMLIEPSLIVIDPVCQICVLVIVLFEVLLPIVGRRSTTGPVRQLPGQWIVNRVDLYAVEKRFLRRMPPRICSRKVPKFL